VAEGHPSATRAGQHAAFGSLSALQHFSFLDVLREQPFPEAL
jgi:hypothetical protein